MSQPKQADAEHKATAFYIRFKAELAANVYTEVVYAVNKERMEENGPIAATDDLKIVCKVEVTVDSPKKYYQEFQDSAKDAEIVWDLSFAAGVMRDLMQEATVFTRFTPCLTKHHHVSLSSSSLTIFIHGQLTQGYKILYENQVVCYRALAIHPKHATKSVG